MLADTDIGSISLYLYMSVIYLYGSRHKILFITVYSNIDKIIRCVF